MADTNAWRFLWKKAIISQFFETKSASSIAKEHIRERLDTGFTNGYTEGMNKKIKVLKRVGYGGKGLIDLGKE